MERKSFDFQFTCNVSKKALAQALCDSKPEEWKGQQIGQPLCHIADPLRQVQPLLQPPTWQNMVQLYPCMVEHYVFLKYLTPN